MATKYEDRPIPQISLANFESRVDEITEQLVTAAEQVGFFAIVDHGVTTEQIDSMFAMSERFFALPNETKSTVAWNPNNVGWEHKSQIRPSTGAADQKESYQLQFGEHMKGMWISEDACPGFHDQSWSFMHLVQGVSEKLMICFARGLGFPDDFFVRAHDVTKPNCQSVLRLLHYFETPRPSGGGDGQVYHRAGAHADWDLLTLLFQREGQSGLEICPGREVVTEWASGNEAWTKVDFVPGSIVCNIGDLLMSWSDDRFKSTLHRVKAPCEEGDNYDERYSIAFFNQPSKDTIIQGPLKKYPAVTGEEFNAKAMKVQFTALQAKLQAEEEAKRKREAAAAAMDKVIPAGTVA
ncbi:Isopenicillin N synthase [Geosmithia morbida]|uniref:Isopenicillin N synthase n=1 Tax=Geosmithia morbida TaxID=1094350 RepID=A0A9P4Z211_9HYPO|nr:Isopenicillin N synthase [Geosmithia morbida]KAF4125818.1 Isopenicillin N synthase [Geosmithia morbida]